MNSMKRYILVYGLGVLLGGFTWLRAQDQAKLTARELFYGAGKKVASAPTANPSQPTKTAKSGTPLNQPTASTINKEPTVTAGRPAPGTTTRPAITVDYSPLGLRYSLLRRTGGGQYDETDVDSSFRSGDGIRDRKSVV